jgi:hypothetical protein
LKAQGLRTDFLIVGDTFVFRVQQMSKVKSSSSSSDGGGSKSPEIELVYMNQGGRALMIRLAFAIGEVKFKDTRLKLREMRRMC